VVDVALYPFLDINFGLGVHNLANGLLHLVIHMPAMTIERCKAGGGPVVATEVATKGSQSFVAVRTGGAAKTI
jgi:hypothetical protein